MDSLAEIFSGIRLDDALFFNADFRAPWCIREHPSQVVAPYLMGRRGHVIIFHLVLEGHATVEIEGEERRLSAGDIVVIPHGDEHLIWNSHPKRPVDALKVFGTDFSREMKPVRYGGDGEVTKFVCGFVGCAEHQSAMVLEGLPRLLVVKLSQQPGSDWLRDLMEGLAGRDAGGPSAIVRTKLAEGLFIEALGRYGKSLASDASGWLAGSRDAFVGKALRLIHSGSEPWSLTSLASEVGLSRSRLAERFQTLLGCSAIAYQTKWRLRLAADLLGGSNTVSEVAHRVGYTSEAGFSRAFSREFGLPPSQFRNGESLAATPSS